MHSYLEKTCVSAPAPNSTASQSRSRPLVLALYEVMRVPNMLCPRSIYRYRFVREAAGRQPKSGVRSRAKARFRAHRILAFFHQVLELRTAGALELPLTAAVLRLPQNLRSSFKVVTFHVSTQMRAHYFRLWIGRQSPNQQ